MENKQGFYYIIPAPLMEARDLTKAAIYGLISNLANNEGFCYASNAYLAKKLERKSVAVISNKISELESEGWIRTEVNKADGNSRKIWLTAATPIMKKHKRSYEKTENPSYEKSEDSNTSLVIKESNKETSKEVSEYNKLFADLMDQFKAVNPTHYKLFGNKTQRTALQNLVDKFGEPKVREIIVALPKFINKPFAPNITTPVQLERDLGKLVAFVKKEQGKEIKFVTL